VRGLLIPAAAGLDPSRRYRLDPDVALRPERFGALAYHYGNRRLNFLRSELLARVVTELGDHASLEATLDALVPVPEHPAYRRALAALAASQFIQPYPEC
jgi:putative mycofactocin binding protein MftB